jgi:type VI secretion system secreted protein VgrG
MVTDEYVTNVRMRRELKPGRVMLQDREHRTSPEYALRAKAMANVLETEKQLEQFKVMPERFLVQSNQGGGTPVADDRGMVRSDERHAENLG